MKLFATFTSLLILSVFSYGQSATESYQAELSRSTAGRVLDDRGLAAGTMPLKKGSAYNVVEQKVGYLVISVQGKKVSIPPGDAIVTKGTVAPPTPRSEQPVAQRTPEVVRAPEPVAVTPGTIELVSAKYTLMGNQPRNVKNKLAKLIPAGVIDKSVSILVSDTLSTAAAAQGNSSVVPMGGRTYLYQQTPRNILTVEYLFNGESRVKQAMEGTYLTLP